MKKNTTWILVILSTLLLISSCGKFEDIAIHGIKSYKLRGISNGHILINLTLDIENPNNRKITVSKIHFKTWLNNRELGTIKNSEKIVLKPNSNEEYDVPIEIVLRTEGDVYKLMNLKSDILDQLTIEGFIKGRVMCVSKKIRIKKQPFNDLAKSYKKKNGIKNSPQIKDIEQIKDTLKVK